MTANEMKESLEAQVDILSSYSAPAIPDFQASDFLNQAVHGLLNRIKAEGLEKDEFNRRFIAPLKKAHETTSEITTTLNHRYGTFFAIPSNVFLMLTESAQVDKRGCFSGDLLEVTVVPKTEDYYEANIGNHEKKPYLDTAGERGEIWRIDFANINDNNKLSELITDGTFNVTKYKFRYLAYPKRVVVNLESPEEQINSEIYEEFHQGIVTEAALIAMENMGLMSRIQAKAALVTKQNQ